LVKDELIDDLALIFRFP